MTGTPRPCAAKMWFCSWSGLWEQQAGGKAVRRCLWLCVGAGWTDHGGVLLVVPDVVDLVGDAVRHHRVLDPDARADREALRLELGAERLDGLQAGRGGVVGGWPS